MCFFQPSVFRLCFVLIVKLCLFSAKLNNEFVFAFLFLKESLTPIEMIGLGIVVAALVGFGWPQKIKISGATTAIILALACGLLTAIYTVIDAYGMRLAQTA